jgi:hypothetical protein
MFLRFPAFSSAAYTPDAVMARESRQALKSPGDPVNTVDNGDNIARVKQAAFALHLPEHTVISGS